MRKRLITALFTVAVAGGTGYGVAQAGAPSPASPQSFTATHGKVSHVAANPTVQPETYFVSVPACRIVSTSGHGGPFAPNQIRSFYVRGTSNFPGQGGRSGGCGIPETATAIAGRLTTVAPTATGTFIAYPTGAPVNTGTDFYTKAITSSVGITQPLADGSVKPLTVKNLKGRSNLMIDVTGYYLPQMEGYVGGDGTLQTGTSRIVSTSHAGTGAYYITLDRPVRSCSVQATAYNLYRFASVGYSSASTPNTVSVYIWYMNAGTPTLVDYPFHVLVVC